MLSRHGDDLRDYTALGYWTLRAEIICCIEMLREEPEAADLGWQATEPTEAGYTLQALAGLRSDQELVDECAQYAGEVMRDWLEGWP